PSGPGSDLTADGFGGGEATFSASWRLEIAGLEDAYAPFNNVYVVRRAEFASTWENGGDSKSHCRVTMNHSADSRCWVLMVLRNGLSLTAEAPADMPFGPLRFAVHGPAALRGNPRIAATAVAS